MVQKNVGLLFGPSTQPVSCYWATDLQTLTCWLKSRGGPLNREEVLNFLQRGQQQQIIFIVSSPGGETSSP